MKDNWISTKERLPEDGRNVLVADIESDIVTVGYYSPFKLEGWITDTAGVNVTHWQPLPSPPKRNNKQ